MGAVSALIGVWQTYLTTLLGNRVTADLRSRLFAHLQRMDLAFFTATRTGAMRPGPPWPGDRSGGGRPA